MSNNIDLDKTRPLKQIAREIFLQTILQIDPEKLLTSRLKRKDDLLTIDGEQIDLSRFDRIIVIGFGKASLKMATALQAILHDRNIEGIVATNGLMSNLTTSGIEVIIAGHPYPNEGSIYAASRAIDLVSGADSSTLIFYLISGGGSALFEKPLDDSVSLDDLQQLNRVLVNCGATIREINTIRKHLSAVKGGRLATLAPNSQQVSLYISDVNSDQLSTIASDPTGADDTTLEEFYQIVERYDLRLKLPTPIASLISDRRIPETPKGDNDCFRDFQRHLLIDNQELLTMVARLTNASGWLAAIDFNNNEDHYRMVADRLLNILQNLATDYPGKPVCLVSGGEVICPVSGAGIGGRNQEFALYCATQLNELFPDSDVAVLSAGTDGIDGNSDAAGAVVDGNTVSSLAMAQEYLRRNDSYSYLNMIGDVVTTGPTGTNVRDLRLLFLRPR